MLYQPNVSNYYDFRVVRDQDRCIKCQGCVTQCSYGSNFWDGDRQKIDSIHSKCVGCHRCEAFCPTGRYLYPSATLPGSGKTGTGRRGTLKIFT